MVSIAITSEYGVIVRKNSLPERLLTLDQVLKVMETSKPFSEDENLLAFGPSFGQEALDTFRKRLEILGLRYWDDFFEFTADCPPWCGFRAEFRVPATTSTRS
jgi:hypothetical protein